MHQLAKNVAATTAGSAPAPRSLLEGKFGLTLAVKISFSLEIKSAFEID